MRVMALLLCFFMDVRVKAASAFDETCFGLITPCAISTVERIRKFESSNIKLSLGKHSVVEHRVGGDFQMVLGQAWFSSGEKLLVATPFAAFTCESSCSALFERTMDEVEIKTLEGRWQIKRLGDPRNDYDLEVGMRLKISGVDSQGKAFLEFPQSLPWKETTAEWAKFFQGDENAFKAELTRFRPEWRRAVELVSSWHQIAARRTIATHEESLARLRARQREQAEENKRLRTLFRQKNYIDP